jgi:acetoin utilization protein AcuC
MPAPFFYSPRILEYDFGPKHPLKPERLRRTVELLARYGVESIDPGLGADADALRVHTPEYVQAVQALDPGRRPDAPMDLVHQFGFGPGDTPAFSGMYEAARAYTSCSCRAAEAVRDGAPLAFAIGGGLHHAMPSRASGFCLYNDVAAACHVLLERHERVAYVDIDVHHGDGVQWMFYDEPRVLTCSIHEEGRTLFPGTGALEETGAQFSSLNVPIQAMTTGAVWLQTFERTILPALEAYEPGAIVLQLGTDTHFLDPLGHLMNTQQEWLAAAMRVVDLGCPTVVCGGGGYNLTTVPRMWVSAVLSMMGIPYDDRLPNDLAEAWEMPRFSDPVSPGPRGLGGGYADAVVSWISERFLPNIPRA